MIKRFLFLIGIIILFSLVACENDEKSYNDEQIKDSQNEEITYEEDAVSKEDIEEDTPTTIREDVTNITPITNEDSKMVEEETVIEDNQPLH